MTPEELNRTIEFIIQSQARLAVAQEQDRAERIEFQRWSKDLNRQVLELIQAQNTVIEIQSRRLDQYEKEQRTSERAAQKRHDELHLEYLELMRELRDGRKEAQKQHEETLAWLQRIVEKITDRLN